MGISIVVENTVQGFGFRRLFEDIIIDKRIAYPMFSAAGLTEIGLINISGPIWAARCCTGSGLLQRAEAGRLCHLLRLPEVTTFVSSHRGEAAAEREDHPRRDRRPRPGTREVEPVRLS